MFSLKTDPVTDDDLQRMDLLYWKWRQQWETKYEAKEINRVGDEPFDVNGEHPLGDLHDWERFADENYNAHAVTFGCVIAPLVLLLLSARGAA
jgi:hypothetical protein